jgi:hypothetical protein
LLIIFRDILVLWFLNILLLGVMIIIVLWFLGTLLLRFWIIMALRFLIAIVLWLLAPMLLGFRGIIPLGFMIIIVLGLLGAILLISRDIMVFAPLLDLAVSFSPYVISRLILVPIIIMPVMTFIPFPPAFMEIVVVYPVISRRHIVNIFRRYSNNESRDHRQINIVPVPVVDGRPEPITIIEPIPVTTVEIDPVVIWHHIDIADAAGNYDDIRRCGKW